MKDPPRWALMLAGVFGLAMAGYSARNGLDNGAVPAWIIYAMLIWPDDKETPCDPT